MSAEASPASPWLKVAPAAIYSGRGEDLVRAALASQELRGYQRTPGGHWSIHVDDLDAWIRCEQPAPSPAPRVARPQRVG